MMAASLLPKDSANEARDKTTSLVRKASRFTAREVFSLLKYIGEVYKLHSVCINLI